MNPYTPAPAAAAGVATAAACLGPAVLVNGAAFTKGTRRRVGFVLQDDVLYESLTVKVRPFFSFCGG